MFPFKKKVKEKNVFQGEAKIQENSVPVKRKMKKQKISKREAELLDNYAKGRILHVNDGVDNVKHFASISKENE